MIITHILNRVPQSSTISYNLNKLARYSFTDKKIKLTHPLVLGGLDAHIYDSLE